MDGDDDWVIWVSIFGGVAAVALTIYGIRRFMQGRRYRGEERLDGKVAIVTGCNGGIGKAHVIDLARRGARVYMACRNRERCEAARLDVIRLTGNADVHNATLDLSSLQSVRDFVRKFGEAEQRLDLLVNNAAIIPAKRETTVDGFEMQFGTNQLGPFLLTHLLLDVLRASAPSRIVIVSSTAHYLGTIHRDDLQTEHRPYGALTNYNHSKLANVLWMRALSGRLNGTGVTVNALHPGVVETSLSYSIWWLNVLLFPFRLFYRTPEAGAQTQIRLSVDPSLQQVSGRYFDNCRERQVGQKALDDETAEWLWSKCAELAGVQS